MQPNHNVHTCMRSSVDTLNSMSYLLGSMGLVETPSYVHSTLHKHDNRSHSTRLSQSYDHLILSLNGSLFSSLTKSMSRMCQKHLDTKYCCEQERYTLE